eukprot:1160979-Pelagomonas_calceolata.AAC.6
MKTHIVSSASSSCTRGCSAAPASLVKPISPWSSQRSALQHVALHHCKLHPFHIPSPSLLAPCAARQGWEQPGSEPEDAAYNELLARRREERLQAIREASRRARFNPLNRKAADAPASEKQHDQQEQPAQPLRPSPAASPSEPSTSKSGGSKSSSAVRGQPKQRPAGAPLRPTLSARRTRRKGGGLGNMPRRSMSSSLQQRRQLALAGADPCKVSERLGVSFKDCETEVKEK